MLIMESTKTIQLKITGTYFDLAGTFKKYANLMNYFSSMVLDNRIIISPRKLQPMVYTHLRGNIGLKSKVSCNIPRQVLGLIK
jgi:hypothetical protein